MLNFSNGLVLLIFVMTGAALFFACREFIRGLKSARFEYQEQTKRKYDSREKDDFARQQKHLFAETTKSKQWYDVLEVASNADREEVKSAYRRMIALYHPDRVAGLGLELQEVADRRAKEINEAYLIARKLLEF